MCFYLLDVRIPKKVANIFKKIISDKNIPEIVQILWSSGPIRVEKQPYHVFLHDTAVYNFQALRID